MRRDDKKKGRFKKSILCFLAYGTLMFTYPLVGFADEVVLASTSLAGAIARAAGAKEVRVLTPSELRHPPEYELKPSDLVKFEGAAAVVYAGYEKMVTKLLETSRNKNLLTVQVDTTTSPENLVTQVKKVAAALKTESEAERWQERFLGKLKDLQKSVAPYAGKRTVVHFHAQPFARWVGLSIVQVIRPGELTPKAISEAIAQNPELVLDILHLPLAKVIAENAKCRYAQIINFPGFGNTVTLEDIFEYNSAELARAFHPFGRAKPRLSRWGQERGSG